MAPEHRRFLSSTGSAREFNHLLFIWYNNAGLSHCHLCVPAPLLWGQGEKKTGEKKIQQNPHHDLFICRFVQFRTWSCACPKPWAGIKPELAKWPWQSQVPRDALRCHLLGETTLAVPVLGSSQMGQFNSTPRGFWRDLGRFISLTEDLSSLKFLLWTWPVWSALSEPGACLICSKYNEPVPENQQCCHWMVKGKFLKQPAKWTIYKCKEERECALSCAGKCTEIQFSCVKKK